MRGERAVGEIGGDARLLVLDVTDAASIAAAARRAGTLDILVNNAGISGDGEQQTVTMLAPSAVFMRRTSLASSR